MMITQQLVRQVTGQQENQRVYKIDLCNKLITRISGLKPFSKIRCLQLDFNRIRTIENLECLTDLRELHLEYNEIERLEGLDNNKMLTVLALTSNKIQKIQNIGHLIKLETLIIDNNKLDKVSGLETLKDLKYLSMSGNNLTSIDSLPAFSKLQTLNADKNKIKKISPIIFAKSTKLTKLDLSYNEIQDIIFVNGLISLEELNVSNNKIVNLQMTALKNLQYLDISNNKIEKLPKIAELFPELTTFLLANNQIISEFQIIQSLSQAQMLVEIDFRGNPMQTPEFVQTLYKIHGFDRINEKNYNKPGTRYLNRAQEINKVLKEEGFGQIQNDEQVRKIMMSGFYNDDIETDMTGVRPDRPNSGNRTRIGPALNFEEMEKSYNDIMKNNSRLEYLREQCLHVFKQNGIKIEVPPLKQQQTEDSYLRYEQKKALITQVKNNVVDKKGSMTQINDLTNRNEENANKWKELKNRQKNFNIRGVVRRMSGSQRKQGTGLREQSSNKIPPLKEKPELMKTQLNPPRWNNDPALMKTMYARPFSAKKKEK